jgi:hypothetical protein
MVVECLQKKKAKKQFQKAVPISKKINFSNIRSALYIAEIFSKISSQAIKSFQLYYVNTLKP